MPRRFSSSAVSKDSEGAAFTLLHPHCLSLPPTAALHSWDSLLVAGVKHILTPGTKANICGVSVIYVFSLWGKKNGGSIRKPSVWRRSVSCFWEGGWLLYVNTDGAWTPERLLHCLAFSSSSMFSYVCVMSSTFSQCIAKTHNSSFLLFSFCSPHLLPPLVWALQRSHCYITHPSTPKTHPWPDNCLLQAQSSSLATHQQRTHKHKYVYRAQKNT